MNDDEKEQHNITISREFLEARGFVVLREKSYRRAQERQRMAEVRYQDEVERRLSHESWVRDELFTELRSLRERCTFLYGAARAAGCSAEELVSTVAAL